jgi:hypothetical protein
MKKVTAEDVERALVAALPSDLMFVVDRSDSMVCVTLRVQPGIPWEIHVGWEGGEGEHLLWIFSDPLKHEDMYLEAIDDAILAEFKTFVEDLLHGRIKVELSKFRSSGKLWRTRLLDPQRPEDEQVIHRYYRRPFRWWRSISIELVQLGNA